MYSNITYVSAEERVGGVIGQTVKSLADIECLQARAAARIPHLDGVIPRRHRQLGRVAQEGYGANPIVIYERL